MSSSKLGSSGRFFGGTKWTRQLVVVKYSATGEIVEDKLYEENLDEVIQAIGGDGIIAELECYRHPLLVVYPKARLAPAVGIDNWLRDLKYQCIESFKQLNDHQKIKKTLNATKRTDPVLYHCFVVFKVVQKQENSDSTKVLWCSIEKNTTYLLIQCSENKDDVKFENKRKKRPEEVKPLSYIYEHVGQKSVQDLLHFLREEKELDNLYHLFDANCQSFAEKIISYFKIDSPSSRNWYDFQKIIHFWSTLDWAITPISCPIAFHIEGILFLTEIGHMPSKMSLNYRLTFRKTLLKVIEKLKDVVNTGSGFSVSHGIIGMVTKVDHETLRMLLEGLEEFNNVLEEETINGFVFLSWMGRSKTRLEYEERVLEKVTQWHTESMAEEYRKYKERISLLDEVVPPIQRPIKKKFSLSRALNIEKSASLGTQEEMSPDFDSNQQLFGSFNEFMTRDPADGDFSAVHLENDSIAQYETKERKPVMEEIEWISNYDTLRRLYEESINSGKISPSDERDSDEDSF